MRVMFSLTLISGRSCSLRAAQSELEEAKLGKGKRVCKRVLGREEGERDEGKGRRREGSEGERGGTDWIVVCVCVCVCTSEERGRESDQSSYQKTGVMEDRTLSVSLCVSTMPVSLLHLLPSLPRQCLELRSAN